ncbi:MAG: hypothetical protein K0S61_4733 [Anaerocolumna sp.]|jgi:hypothetical protein|nr:hypothetical protein [Anaerocolumna sp.]
MKEKKRRFEQFILYDYTGIEIHLNKMAEKGWKLQKISPFYWEYGKIEPQNLTYAVTYFSEASEFNPYPTQNQRTFHNYCKNAGWNLVTEWAQMQIFITDQKDTIPIETEESVKLSAIHRAMKKNFIPSNIILLLLAVAQIIFSLHMIMNNPISNLTNNTTVCNIAMFIILFIQTLTNLFCYAVWYSRSKKAIGIGEPCTSINHGYRYISLFTTLLILIIVSLSMFSLSAKLFGWVSLWIFLNIGVLIPLVNKIKKTLKRAQASKRVNLSITIFSCVLLSIIFTIIMTMGLIKGLNAGWIANKPDATYTTTNSYGYTHTWDIYHDELPLTIEDLQNVNYDHYSYKWTEDKSLLLSLSVGDQSSFPDDQNPPNINYEIVQVKIPILFDLCLKDYLDKYNYDFPMPEEERRQFKEIDAPLWQADAVYQLFNHEREDDEYIICWSNRILYINFPTIPTADQISIAVEKLGK